MGLDRIDAVPDVYHDGDVILDEFHRGHHLLDALAGQILEIAGLENRDDALLDFLAQQLLLIGRIHFHQRAGGLVDRLGGFQDLLRGLFGAADHGAEFAIDAGHFLAAEALAVQNRDFALGAVDGVVDQVKFHLEFLALLDLGPIGFEHRLRGGDFALDRYADLLGSAARRGHLTADGAQFAHDLAMHGTDISIGDGGHRHVAGNCCFDTKTSAMNRHEALPELHWFLLSRCDLTWSSRRNLLSVPPSSGANLRLTMCGRHSSKINATGQNGARLTTW